VLVCKQSALKKSAFFALEVLLRTDVKDKKTGGSRIQKRMKFCFAFIVAIIGHIITQMKY
jgi:hypothetical protein